MCRSATFVNPAPQWACGWDSRRRKPNIFNAGARRAALTAAEHRYNEARLAWEQSFLLSLREVADSLILFRRAGEQLDTEIALERASQAYLDLAFKRYRNGILAYIDVLDAQHSLYAARIALSQAREARLTALFSLYRALRGGWTHPTTSAAR